jgi:hypothetical protein
MGEDQAAEPTLTREERRSRREARSAEIEARDRERGGFKKASITLPPFKQFEVALIRKAIRHMMKDLRRREDRVQRQHYKALDDIEYRLACAVERQEANSKEFNAKIMAAEAEAAAARELE